MISFCITSCIVRVFSGRFRIRFSPFSVKSKTYVAVQQQNADPFCRSYHCYHWWECCRVSDPFVWPAISQALLPFVELGYCGRSHCPVLVNV